MTANHAWLLKGWLLGQNPPKEITEAMEVLLTRFDSKARKNADELVINTNCSPSDIVTIDGKGRIVKGTLASHHDETPPKKQRKPWSQEARDAAAERMRAMQATKKAKRASPGEVQAPSQGGA